MTRKCTQDSFLENVATHVMHVENNNGVYRHLKFRRPGTVCLGFDIITYPGYLVMSGDMGSWVFSRLPDMFEFFRTKPQEDDPTHLHINRDYWSEKLEAVDRHSGGATEFSADRFHERVEEHVADWLADQEGLAEVPSDLRELIDELLSNDDFEESARGALNNFDDPEKRLVFSDTWEWDLSEYTYRFTWACYAISWAIRTFDAAEVAARPGAIGGEA